MKTTPPRPQRRPTASADRSGDDLSARVAPETRCCGPRRPVETRVRGGLFTGGETLH